MKLVIFGGRDFNDFELLNREVINYIVLNNQITEDVLIISGGANGADRLGEIFANTHALKLKRFIADWNQHGRAAGPIRNREMATDCTHAIAFWDGESKGTLDMINKVNEQGKPIKVIKYKTNQQ